MNLGIQLRRYGPTFMIINAKKTYTKISYIENESDILLTNTTINFGEDNELSYTNRNKFYFPRGQIKINFYDLISEFQ